MFGIVKEKYSSVLIVVIAVAGAVLIFYFKDGKKNNLPNNGPNPVSTGQIGPDQFKNLIISKYSKINIPEVTNQTSVKTEDLPEDLGILLTLGFQDLKTQRINFANNRSGYLITGTIEGDLQSLQLQIDRSVSQSTNWQKLAGIRGDQVAILEFENSKYQTRILLTKPSPSSAALKAEINVLSKL